MPTKGSHWSPEHRAAFAATVAKRHAANPPKRSVVKSERATAHQRLDLIEQRVGRLADRVNGLEGGRGTDLERAVNATGDTPGAYLRDLGRIERILTRIIGRLDDLDKRVDAVEKRPLVQEWKLNHRRLADGGLPVRKQRKQRKNAKAQAAQPG